jgi:hypothetical protein
MLDIKNPLRIFTIKWKIWWEKVFTQLKNSM